jgi:RNA polymerase sigma-70 factor (ECF subfamily)
MSTSTATDASSCGTTTATGSFSTTRWTLVLQAGNAADAATSRRALEELFRIYWKPLYAYTRRRGHSQADAEDLTQSFFARLLQHHNFAGVNPGHGRFRAFLLASLKHHLANAHDYATRQKRGGGAPLLPLEWEDAERMLRDIPDPAPAPDAAFDREWARVLLERVLLNLRAEWVARGKAALFDIVRIFLTPDKAAATPAEMARNAGMEEGALRVLAHRLRKRYRELLKAEVARTVSDPAMVAEELRTLLVAFA